VVGLFAGLVLWLMRSSHPAMAAASAQSLGTLRAPDVSAIDPNETKHSDALPTPMPARPQNVATQPVLDTSLLAQNPNQFSQTSEASAPSTGSTAVVDTAKHQALEADRLHRQQIADARESDMTVKLPDSEPARSRSDAPLMPSGQVLATQPNAESESPTGPVIQRGMIIPASLYTPIDSTVPGIITAQIREDVYDATHRVLVIPRGSKLIGSYESAMTQGQARLFAGFDSIKLPNLRTIDLGSMRGVDLNGVAGLGGTVDFHTGRLFSNVLLLSVLAAGAQLAQPRVSGCGTYGCQESAGQAIGSAVGSNVANAATQTYDRRLSQPPTMHVPSGYILNVMVERDLALPAYHE
jgi:type IV secretory pathway VirB10-like protein